MRDKFLFFCSCTFIEIITAIGVTTYLYYLGESILFLISLIIFGKLILFHFIMEYFDRKNLKQKIIKI
ncbi:hypothetical protein NSED_08630 [Candidatus Nitrosopumilus sediminis]|uniref:Uncharacterized protein n=1 Tax=Candidatus Nitrosopumilus sediminis TaxID=1229909 RepID=K0BBC5_9ARCH|nr:hypothetical protein NSED_08630 [Candidatus Nitrosopumilus sediminis]